MLSAPVRKEPQLIPDTRPDIKQGNIRMVSVTAIIKYQKDINEKLSSLVGHSSLDARAENG